MTFSIYRLLLTIPLSCFLTFLCLKSTSANENKPASIFDLGEISFETRGNSRKIPIGSVMSLAQDNRKFIWVGTQMGLLRYDGYNFSLYEYNKENKNSISGNFINTIWASDSGSIWIGTFSDGVTKFSPKNNKFTHFKHEEQKVNSLSNDTILAITGDESGRVFVGTNDGLNVINGNTHETLRVESIKGCPNSLIDGKVESLLPGNNNTLWIGTSSGLCNITLNIPEHLEQSQGQHLTGYEIDNLNGHHITELVRARDNTIWIGTRNNGAIFFDENNQKQQFRITHDPNNARSLAHPHITSIVQINNDEIWLGTYGGGLTSVKASNGQAIKNLRHDSSIESSINLDRIGAMLVDDSGLVWIGTWGGGLNLYNPFNTALRNIHSTPFDNRSLSISDSHTILELENKEIWVGHSQVGLDIIDSKLGVIDRLHSASNDQSDKSINNIRSLTQLNDGSIWAGTAQSGLLYFDELGNKFEFADLLLAGSPGAIRCMTEGEAGQLWAGTDSGIILMNVKTKKAESISHIENIELITNQQVLALTFQSPQHIWLASTTGLFVIDILENKLSEISERAGTTNTLSDNYITDVIFDQNDRLIVSTAQGLDRLVSYHNKFATFESLDQLAKRPPRRAGNLMEDDNGRIRDNQGWLDPNLQTFQNLNIADGFDVGTIWYGSNKKLEDGTLIYGGTKGLLLVRPELWQPWEYQPPIVITELTVDNQQAPVTDELQLSGESNSFSIEFAALDFTDPESNQYAYKLEGFDNDWIATTASNRRATYTNLPPGQYRLKVKGTNRKGIWSEQELSMPIQQLPTWYQTLWFRFAMLLSISGLLLSFYKWRVKRLKNQRAALDNMVKSRTANITMLGTIGQEITATLNLDKVLETVYQHVNTLMRAEVFAIGIVDKTRQVVHLPFCIENGQRLPPIKYKMSDTDRPAVWCIQNQKELRVSKRTELAQVLQNVQDPISGGKSESLIYLPLMIDQKVIGCVSVQSFSQNAYDDNDVQMLRTIANYAAIALANADSVEKLESTLAELKETQNQLVQQEKMAGLGTLTAGVMHEINNPTNFTHTSLYNLRDKHDELFVFLHKLAGGDQADKEILELFDRKRKELESITDTAEEGTNRIKKIVSDLQNLSRVDKDQKRMANIRELLASSINLARTNYPNHIFDTDSVTGSELLCYPSKLSQVLLNLLVNACQAIEEAQVTEPELQGMIRLSTKITNETLTLTIRDNGCGMDEVTLKKAFEPFFTTKEVGSGTGLGMSISYSIIEEHKGKMTVESEPGKGTVIRLYLPLLPDE